MRWFPATRGWLAICSCGTATVTHTTLGCDDRVHNNVGLGEGLQSLISHREAGACCCLTPRRKPVEPFTQVRAVLQTHTLARPLGTVTSALTLVTNILGGYTITQQCFFWLNIYGPRILSSGIWFNSIHYGWGNCRSKT